MKYALVNLYSIFLAVSPLDEIEKKNLLFKWFGIPLFETVSKIVGVAEQQVYDFVIKNKDPVDLWGFSYGGQLAILLTESLLSAHCNVRRVILLSPVLGIGTIKWKWYEELLSILPAFREQRSLAHQVKLINAIHNMCKHGYVEVIIFIPESGEDNRVTYSAGLISNLKTAGARIIRVPASTHHEMVSKKTLEKYIVPNVL